MSLFCREQPIPHVYTPEHERRLRQQRERQAAAQRCTMARVGTVVVLAELSRLCSTGVNHRVAVSRRTTMGTNQSSASLHEERSSECRMSLKGSARCLDGSIPQIDNKTCRYREITGVDVLGGIKFMFDVAAQFYDTYLAAIVEWGLGAAKAAVDKLEKIKDAVVEALDFLFDFIVNLVRLAIDKIFKPLTTRLEDMMADLYANLQNSIAASAMCTEEGLTSETDYSNKTGDNVSLPDESSFSWLTETVLSGTFFYLGVGLVVALHIVRAIILGFTGGASLLAQPIVAMIPGLIVGALVGPLVTGIIGAALYGFFSIGCRMAAKL